MPKVNSSRATKVSIAPKKTEDGDSTGTSGSSSAFKDKPESQKILILVALILTLIIMGAVILSGTVLFFLRRGSNKDA